MKKNSINTVILILISFFSCQKDNATDNNSESFTPILIEGKVKIADWYNFSKAAYSLTFDDSFMSQPKYIAPLLNQNGLKATFYILPNQMQPDKNAASWGRYAYWYQYQELYDQGHEIGAHTLTHNDLTAIPDGDDTTEGSVKYELSQPLKIINQKIPNCKVRSFAYPYTIANQHLAETTAQYYTSARVGWNQSNSKNPELMMLKANLIEYNEVRTIENDTKKIIALQNAIIEKTIDKGNWGIFIAHEVCPLEELKKISGWHPVSLETFIPFVQWLKTRHDSRQLWVGTVGDITKYIKERDVVKSVFWQISKTKFTITLNDNLADDIYNHPVSLEVELPNDWTAATITTPDGTKLKIVITNGKTIINVVPDKGTVVIEKN